LNSDFDYATLKYDTNGNELWVTRYNGALNRYDGAIAIAVDAYGNVYVGGTSYIIDVGWGVGDYAVVKYDTDGNQLWMRYYNHPVGTGTGSDTCGVSGGGGGAGDGAGASSGAGAEDCIFGVGGSVVKALTALQALEVLDPVALTFQ